MKKRLAAVAGVCVSVVLVVALCIGLDWDLFAQELHRVNWAYVPPLLVLLVLTIWIRSCRWHYMLPDGHRLSRRALFDAVMVGFMASFLLPLRAGEIVRPWVLSRWQQVSFTTGLASIMVERIFDTITIFLLFGLCMSRMDAVPDYVVLGAKGLGLMALLMLFFVLACYFQSRRILAWAQRATRFLLGRRTPLWADKAEEHLAGFMEGLKAIRSWRSLLAVTAWSVLLWLAVAAWFQLGLVAFGHPTEPMAGLLVTVMVALAVAAPSAPGFIGTFQAGCVVALSVVLSYSREFAIAYSVFAHGFQVLVIVGAGALVLHRRALSFRQLRKTTTP